MGTPLYKSVPSRDDMMTYEPYLKARAKKKARDDAEPEAENPYGAAAPAVADAGVAGPAEKKPWWQSDFDGGKPDIKLSDLSEGSDALVAKRMVKGFYIAVDRQFGVEQQRSGTRPPPRWSPPPIASRSTSLPRSMGSSLAGPIRNKPVGFMLSTKASKYQVDSDRRSSAAIGPSNASRRSAHGQASAGSAAIVYRETTEGWWMKAERRNVHRSRTAPRGARGGREMDRREPLAPDLGRVRGR